jgi:3-hydroxyisobutyrate dehydrogenase-like beta-hydroxyacid dehydrogenase
VGLLELLKKDPNNNTLEVMEAAIRSLSISSWKLKNQVRQLLKTTLYENGFELTEKHLKDFGLVFKSMDMYQWIYVGQISSEIFWSMC